MSALNLVAKDAVAAIQGAERRGYRQGLQAAVVLLADAMEAVREEKGCLHEDVALVVGQFARLVAKAQEATEAEVGP